MEQKNLSPQKNIQFDVGKLVKQVSLVKAEVQNICHPILDFFSIKYFELYRVYPNDSFIILTTHPEWVEHYFANHYFCTTDTDCHNRLAQFDFILWDHWPQEDKSVWTITQEANNFNLCQTISIVSKSSEAVNVFSFGAPHETQNVYNEYLINMSVLEKFSHYFLSRAHKLISQANTLKSQLPSLHNQTENDISEKKLKILDQLKISQVPFFIDGEDVVLSQKETEIAAYYVQGISAKHIAKNLDCSSRTVEWHIENIKRKLKCSSKTYLCDLLGRNPIISHAI